MLRYIDNHIIKFVDEWGDKIISQIDKVKLRDITNIISKTKRSRIILDSIKSGKGAYIIGFRDCSGMIRKWLYDEKGRIVREQGKGLIEINPSVITMSILDISVPFISSDEVLLVSWHRDKPYNLEKDIVRQVMIKSGFNPKKDIIFIFFLEPSKSEMEINKFLDDFKHIITKEYCRAKGILVIKDPKWIKYHSSDEISKYTNTFFFYGVQLTYTRREVLKKKKLGLD